LRPSRVKPVRDALGIPSAGTGGSPPLRGEGRDREFRLSAALTGPALLPPPYGGREGGQETREGDLPILTIIANLDSRIIGLVTPLGCN